MDNYNLLVLMIGNSRLHWARFSGEVIVENWHSQHLNQPAATKDIVKVSLPLSIASVVPQQTNLWKNYPNIRIINLTDVPLKDIYPTMGIDRALAVWAAGNKYGFPCLVIDGGTALTFTGADGEKSLVGGAILPGLSLQLRSLAQQTAALPAVNLPEELPPPWAQETTLAMQSGVIYGVLAGIRQFIWDWRYQFPDSKVILTGGDGERLFAYLHQGDGEIASEIVVDLELIFWGIKLVSELINCR